MNNYQPSGRRPERTPSAEPVSAGPPALTNAEAVLEGWNLLQLALAKTHAELPALLEQREACRDAVGCAQLENRNIEDARSRLADVERQYAEGTATRSAILGRLIGQRSALEAARASVDAARAEYAQHAVESFQERYRAAVRALQLLWQEGDALSVALRIEVPAPMPCRLTGVVRSAYGWVSGDARLERVPGGVIRALTSAVVIDPHAALYGRLLDRFEKAAGFISGVMAARQPKALLRDVRGFDPNGVYIVAKEFVCHIDARPFTPGMLVDAGLVGSAGTLQRLLAARMVRPLSSGSPSAGLPTIPPSVMPFDPPEPLAVPEV